MPYKLNNKQERVVALAALFQAAEAVTELAKNGRCDTLSYDSLIDSLFVFEPQSTLDVYDNDLSHLHNGLVLLSQLNDSKFNNQFNDIVRYALSLLTLNKQAAKQGDMLQVVHSRLKHLQYKKEHFSGDNHNGTELAHALSGLYQDTLSTLKFRIQVTGNMQHLTQNSVSDRIRAMLFAGIRAAMLWRQLGGNKWQFIFGRGEIQRISQQLLEDTPKL